MGFFHLPVVILEKNGFVSLGNAGTGIGGRQAGRMKSCINAFAAGLHAHQFHGIIQKTGKQAQGIGPPPTQAYTRSGSPPSRSRICCLASMPIMD